MWKYPALRNGLIANWRASRGPSGGRIFEPVTGLYGIFPTLSASAAWAVDSGGYYTPFGGSDRILASKSSKQLAISNGTHSGAAWVYFTTTTGVRAVFANVRLGGSNRGKILLYHDDGGAFIFQRWDGVSSASGDLVTGATAFTATNTWHHVCYSYNHDTGYGALYVNGKLDGSDASLNDQTVPVSGPTPTLLIGQSYDISAGYNFGWQGRIDDVAIWNRVLNPNEVAILAQGGNHVAGRGLLDQTNYRVITPSIAAAPPAPVTARRSGLRMGLSLGF